MGVCEFLGFDATSEISGQSDLHRFALIWPQIAQFAAADRFDSLGHAMLLKCAVSDGDLCPKPTIQSMKFCFFLIVHADYLERLKIEACMN